MKTKIHLWLIVLLMPLVSGAQVDSLRLNKHYFRHYWTDSRDLIAAPLNLNGQGWKGRDWLKLAGVAGITAALTLTDSEIRDFVQDRRTGMLDDVSKYALEPLGDYYAFLITGSLLLHGSVSGDSRAFSTGLLAAESMILSAAMVRISKHMTGRTRPDAWWEPGPHEWKGPFNGKSFPSGHTTTAFALASVLAYQYREHPWVPVTAYSIATLAGLSRVYDNRHWFSDIVAAAALGISTGKFICKQNQNRGASIMPEYSGGTTGLTIVYKW